MIKPVSLKRQHGRVRSDSWLRSQGNLARTARPVADRLQNPADYQAPSTALTGELTTTARVLTEQMSTPAKPFSKLTQELLKGPTFTELNWFKPPTTPDVIKKLQAIKFDMNNIVIHHDEGYQAITPAMNVKALRRYEHPHAPNSVTLFGQHANWHAGMSDAEIVAEARRLLIHLITHEIDEVLFVAGLGPDPHASPVQR